MVSAGGAELFVPPQSGVTGVTPRRESRSSELESESWFNYLLCDLRQVARCHRVCVLIGTMRVTPITLHDGGIKRDDV